MLRKKEKLQPFAKADLSKIWIKFADTAKKASSLSCFALNKCT
jgi:hypothetical protein